MTDVTLRTVTLEDRIYPLFLVVSLWVEDTLRRRRTGPLVPFVGPRPETVRGPTGRNGGCGTNRLNSSLDTCTGVDQLDTTRSNEGSRPKSLEYLVPRVGSLIE